MAKGKDISIIKAFAVGGDDDQRTYQPGQVIEGCTDKLLLALAERGELAQFVGEAPASQPPTPASRPAKNKPARDEPADSGDEQPKGKE